MRLPLCLALLTLVVRTILAQGTVVLQLTDYAAVPQSGVLVNSTDNAVYVARVNFLREEPGGGMNRFFVCDLNGKLYILDHATKQFTTYLDFQRNTTETPNATGLFPAFTRAAGYANGLVTFQFDPEYRTAGSAHFGKFYTVHIEIDTNDGDTRRLPNASGHPGLTNTALYTATAVNEAPGSDNTGTRHAVLIEWQDTNPANTTFEGTARELLRIEFNGRIHPMGDLAFNPRAVSSSDPDYRKMYIAVGDGGAGEQNNAVLHPTPQRIDVLQGKILRISPDDPDGAGPQRYGIPNDNPFTGPAVTVPAGTRPEIWAYGFRNPHRISFDPLSSALIAADIGFHSWEEVNIVRKGANYGYGEREGTFVLNLQTGNANGPLPANDATNGYVYPVIQYPHSPALGYGDAIAGGFVYRGSRIPALRGKFVFGDITTGELFYADLVEMASADDGNPATLAPFHSIDVLWDNPRDAAPAQRYDRLYEIVADEYHARGGRDADLPGAATVSDLTGGGRADIRLALDHAGELYVLSKSDGMIRALDDGNYLATISASPGIARHPESQTVATGGTVVFSVGTGADALSFQWFHNRTIQPNASGLPIVGATGPILTLTNVSAENAGTYAVEVRRGPAWSVSTPATLTVTSSTTPGRLSNLAIRSTAGTGAQTLIVGFALSGPSTATFDDDVLLRAVGPSLARFGVAGVLPDPTISLHRGNTLLANADNWFEGAPGSTDGISPRFGAFQLTTGAPDAILSRPILTRGAYTVQVGSAVANQTGIALAEIYDSPAAGSNARQLVNLSARTQVGTGDSILVAGFVISGTTARTVLIRAAGPALTAFGVTGVLADPKLAIFRGSTVIAESDNWQSNVELVNAFAATGAFDFVARSRDAVLLLTLAPGQYTAHVSGVGTGNAATGVALVEVYTLP